VFFLTIFVISGVYVLYFPSLFVKKLPQPLEKNIDFYAPETVIRLKGDVSDKQMVFLKDFPSFLYQDASINSAFVGKDVPPEVKTNLDIIPLLGNEADMAKFASASGYTFEIEESGNYKLVYKCPDDVLANVGISVLDKKLSVSVLSKLASLNFDEKEISFGSQISTNLESEIDSDAVLKVKDVFYHISKENSVGNLGSVWLSRGSKNDISLYKLVTGKSIFSQQFEDAPSLWGMHLEDISGGEGEASFKVYKTEDAAEGNFALELVAENHTAGLIKDLTNNFNNNSLYFLSFYYKNVSGSPARFYLKEKKLGGKALRLDLPQNTEWKQYRNVFFSPNAKEGLELGFISGGDNLFDAVQIYQVDLAKENLLKQLEIDFPKEEWAQLELNNLSKGQHKLSIAGFENAVYSQNFEKEATQWQTKMEDLSGGPGKARFNVNRSPISSEGKYAMELFSANHTLGLVKQLQEGLKDNAYYFVSFDYRYGKGEAPQFMVSDGQKDYLISEQLEKSNEWKTFNAVFSSRYAKTNGLRLIFSVKSDGSFSSSSLFDNLRLYMIPGDILARFNLVKGDASKQVIPSFISYKKISEGNFEVEVKNASQPYLLVFSESYSPNWKLEGASAKHFKANSYYNAWFIGKKGDYKLKVVYSLLPFYTFAIFVSVISFVGLLLTVVWLILPRKSINRKDRSKNERKEK
jgi:hypothetical protein